MLTLSRRTPLCVVAFLLCLLSALPSRSQTVTVDDFLASTYRDANGHSLPYRLFVPKDYNPTKEYPLVLFLHGAGERGSDNRAQLTGQTAPLVFVQPDAQAANPCFMLAPQCPDNESWVNFTTPTSYSLASTPISNAMQDVLGLTDTLQQQYHLDAQRLYVTGLSMGGFGTWDVLMREPGKFAAGVPIAGAGDPSQAANIKDTPTWIFHSADDGTVPVAGARDMVAALRAAGGSPRYTEYANAGHFSWIPAYTETPELQPWLFSQRLSASPVPEPSELICLIGGVLFLGAALRRMRRSR